MPPNESQAEPVVSRKAETAHLKPWQFGSPGVDPVEKAHKAHESRRRNREERTRGPREVVAQTLIKRSDLVEKAITKALEDAASEDAKLRISARAVLPKWFDQGLGRIETRSPDTETPEGQLPSDREGRERLMAAIEAYEAAGEE